VQWTRCRNVSPVSQRRACKLLDQPRSTQRLVPPVPGEFEERLRAWLRKFAVDRPRWGWRRAYIGLRAEGWTVNRKRVRRLWREEGLRVPARGRRKPPRGDGVVGAFCPIRPNVLWAMDFQFDQTSDGRNLKLLNIIDEFTREALATDVERSITADMVVASLDRLAGLRGNPAYLRFDNGPEFIAGVVADWAKDHGAEFVFNDPGSPWQNAWVESFNGRLRDELLNGERFDSLLEARVVINDWRHDYNSNRPHSSLGNLTPAAHAAQWHTRQQALANSHC
jgi:putative transposase